MVIAAKFSTSEMRPVASSASSNKLIDCCMERGSLKRVLSLLHCLVTVMHIQFHKQTYAKVLMGLFNLDI